MTDHYYACVYTVHVCEIKSHFICLFGNNFSTSVQVRQHKEKKKKDPHEEQQKRVHIHIRLIKTAPP